MAVHMARRLLSKDSELVSLCTIETKFRPVSSPKATAFSHQISKWELFAEIRHPRTNPACISWALGFAAFARPDLYVQLGSTEGTTAAPTLRCSHFSEFFIVIYISKSLYLV